MRVIDRNDEQFDEAVYVVVDRHDLHLFMRYVSTAIQSLEENRAVTAYKGLDKVYEMLGDVTRMNRRLFTFDEETE